MRRGRKAVKRTRLRCSGSVFPLSDGGKNAVAVSSASFPEALSVCLTSGLSHRRKGLQASSSLIREGTVGSSCARLASHASKNALNVLLLGSTRRAKRRLASVYSCAQKINVSGGKPRSFSKATLAFAEACPRIRAHSRLQIRYRHKRGLAHQGCDKRCGQAYSQERSAPKSRPPKRIRYRPLSPCDHMDQRGFPTGPRPRNPSQS